MANVLQLQHCSKRSWSAVASTSIHAVDLREGGTIFYTIQGKEANGSLSSNELNNIQQSLLARILKEIPDSADIPSKWLKVDLEELKNCIHVAAFDVNLLQTTSIKGVKLPQLTLDK